jgi:hypothetical protein
MIRKCVLCVLFLFAALITVGGVSTGESVFYTDKTAGVDIFGSRMELLTAVHQEYGTPQVPHDLFYLWKFYENTSIFEKDFQEDVEPFLDQREKQWWFLGSTLLEGSGREHGNTHFDAWSRYGRFASEYGALQTSVPPITPTERPTTKALPASLLPKMRTSSIPCNCAGMR